MRFGEIGAGQVRFIVVSPEKKLFGREMRGVADANSALRRIGKKVVVCILV